jgi:hypothetical protein
MARPCHAVGARSWCRIDVRIIPEVLLMDIVDARNDATDCDFGFGIEKLPNHASNRLHPLKVALPLH